MQGERFRPDLYYRMSVMTLTIPPLRERPEDIPALSETFLGRFRAQIGTSARRFSRDAARALQRYHWPGNVRELMNAVERAVLLCPGEEIGLEDLPESIAGAVVPRAAEPLVDEAAGRVDELAPSWFELSLREAKRAWVASFERRYLEHLLRETGGRIGETARRAGIEPRSLHTKMKAHGLRKEDYRGPRE
jgi:DNA-binding NtrC family response regulator